MDPSFRVGGIVTTDFNYGSYDRAYALVFQPDGMLVAAGSGSAAGRPTFGLARYRPNGRLDEDFGTGGKVITNRVGTRPDLAQALAVQGDDGKLVAAGSTIATSYGAAGFCLMRYQPGGA